MQQRSTAPEFERLIILVNPASTRAAQIKRRADKLRHEFAELPCRVIKTVPGGAAANADIWRSHADLFGPRTLCGIGAGDGTVHEFVNFLLQDTDIANTCRWMPIVPLWGGNANDLAVMLNGPLLPHTLREVCRHGRVISIRPLRCELRLPDNTSETIMASNYISFGATARIAHQLNKPSHRNTKLRSIMPVRWLLEVITTIGTLRRMSGFIVEENGQRREVYEKVFINGPRFAKAGHLPARLSSDSFYARTFPSKRLQDIFRRLFDSIRGRLTGRLLRKTASFTIHSPVTAQFDGETRELPPGTRIRLTVHQQPFYALATKKA